MARRGIKTVTLIDVSDGGAGATGAAGISTAVVYAYQRSATAITTRPANASTWTFSTATLSFTSPVTVLGNGWLSAIPSGTEDLYVVVAIAASASASDSILAGDWTTGQLLSENGADGINTAVVYAYRKSTTALTSTDKPSTDRTWTFASGTFDNNTLGNSFNGLLSGAGTGSLLYACAAVASGTGTSDSVASTDWSAPQLLTQDGTNGVSGTSSRLDIAYFDVLAGTTGVFPTGTLAAGNYTKATRGSNNFQGTNVVTWNSSGTETAVSTTASDYEITQITGDGGATGAAGLSNRIDIAYSDSDNGVGNPQYPTGTFEANDYATASSATTNKFIGTNVVTWTTTEPAVSTTASDYEWTEFVGSDGAPGSTQAVVTVYIVGTTTPTTKPTGNTTYTFSSGAVSFTTANGWSATPPNAGDGESVYTRLATAIGNGTTDVIADTEWSGVVKLGSTGASGINSATLSYYQWSISDTAPTLPDEEVVYTFADASVPTAQNDNNGWNFGSIPSKGTNTILWQTTATAAENTATDTIATTEWSAARDISQDGSIGDPGVSNTGRYSNLQTSPASELTLTTAGAVGNVLTATLGGTAITYTVVTGKTSTTDMAIGLALAIDGNGTFTGSATSLGAVITIIRVTTFSTTFASTGSTTGAYADGDNKDFNLLGTGARWKIRTDAGLIPNTTGGVNQWTTSVDTLFLSSNDENGSAISDYYGQLIAGDLGRLRTDVAAGQGDISVPSFCTLSSVETSPFICDSPAGYVVFKLVSTGTCVGGSNEGSDVTEAYCTLGEGTGWTETNIGPIRMTPTGAASVTGGVWRMAIETVRADTTPTLSAGENVLANFGYNRVVQGTDGNDGTPGVTGTAGSRGPGRFDKSITLTNNLTAPVVGASDSLFNNDARQVLCEALNETWTVATTSCSLAIGDPIAGDAIVITYTSLDGNTVTTRGAIHDGSGTVFSDWATFEVQIDGNLLVQGSVVANALAVDSVTSAAINVQPYDVGVGSSSSGTTSRMVITGDKIEIYEGNTLRVVLGNLN